MFTTLKTAASHTRVMPALLALILAILFIPQAALAANADPIICDISQGDVLIEGEAITYTDDMGLPHEGEGVSASTPIVITGSTTEHTILIKEYKPLNVTFRDLSIDVSSIPNGEGGFVSKCAAYLGGNVDNTNMQGKINLTLEGVNSLVSADYAALAVPGGVTVRIGGQGSLDVANVERNAGLVAPLIGSPVSNNNPPECIGTELSDKSLGRIIIDDGRITASSDGCAIGVGQRCTGGSIIINGGDITATANTYSASGIGGGQDASLDLIAIHGGTVNATGTNRGSGIGGGMHTDIGTIAITGGTVIATGGDRAAGIGGNMSNFSHGDVEVIRISGGDITAIGGKAAAGIGGGADGSLVYQIQITGGNIKAYGGEGYVNEGDATQRVRGEDGKFSWVPVGTQIYGFGAGAGIGNGGAYFNQTIYTSGSRAGQTVLSGDTRYGGSIDITGGEVRAYSGTLTPEEAALLDKIGMHYVDAKAIGDGSYSDSDAFQSEYPYVPTQVNIQGGSVYENDAPAAGVKSDQSLKVTATAKTVKASALKKKSKTVSGAIKVKGNKTAVSYKKLSGPKNLTISKNGKITVKKGTKKGTYSIKVKVTAKASASYNAASKTVRVKVVVK